MYQPTLVRRTLKVIAAVIAFYAVFGVLLGIYGLMNQQAWQELAAQWGGAVLTPIAILVLSVIGFPVARAVWRYGESHR